MCCWETAMSRSWIAKTALPLWMPKDKVGRYGKLVGPELKGDLSEGPYRKGWPEVTREMNGTIATTRPGRQYACDA